ncbi:MAG: response regulator [Chromatiales bacterium]|jgi:putative two-component system response regulator
MTQIEIDETARQARILIVDDQPANVKLLQKALQMAGFVNVIGLTDPRQVEAAYLERPVDLVLLDIRMPHMDGYEVMHVLQRLSSDDHLPILVLTAQTDQQTRDRALSEGATDFLKKPFDTIEVLLRVRNMLAVRRMYQQQLHFNEQLSEKVRERTLELRETIIEMVRRLGRAAEFRDNETGLHIIRMSKFSRVIAERLGISGAESETLEYAAAMHDVGKIGTPDTILLKPGKLNDEEWQVMKQHPLIGAEILSQSKHRLLQLAEIIAMNHHEKWDGSGYPQGLKGEQIPFEARIVAVADVFDALTTVRPYKRPWTLDEAVEHMKKSSGSHFDPQVVDAFLRCLPSILDIRQRYAEPENVNNPQAASGKR